MRVAANSLCRWALALLMCLVHLGTTHGGVDTLGLDWDFYSAAVFDRLAAEFPGVKPVRRLTAGRGSHAVFVVEYPSNPSGDGTAVVKVVRVDKEQPWTEARTHATIAAEARKSEFDNIVPEVYGIIDLTVARPRVKSKAAAIPGSVGQGVAIRTASVDRDGKATHALLMQHLDGYVALTDVPQLRTDHLAWAAEAVFRLHTMGFEHGDLHLGNILVNEAEKKAAILDFQSAKRSVSGSNAPDRVTLGIDGVPIIKKKDGRDQISLATESLDHLRQNTKMTRREALDHLLAALPDDAHRALFHPPIQCVIHDDCRDLEPRSPSNRRHIDL